MDILVSTSWLAAHIDDPDLRVIDATYFALEPDRDARAAYAAGHLPGARFLDLETLCDPDDPLPGMLPGAGAFARRMDALGVRSGDRVVLYDQAPHHTAARAWWMFRLFGITQVALLDGDIAKWRREGRPIATGDDAGASASGFVARKDAAAVRTLDQVRANLATGAEQLLDARSAARFRGDEPDPRPGVAPGHIPGSRNLVYSQLFEADGTWKQGDALRAAYEGAGIDLARPIVTTCGSGVTAAILLFGLALLGKRDVALYDGSWSEWGADPAVPKATGA